MVGVRGLRVGGEGGGEGSSTRTGDCLCIVTGLLCNYIYYILIIFLLRFISTMCTSELKY